MLFLRALGRALPHLCFPVRVACSICLLETSHVYTHVCAPTSARRCLLPPPIPTLPPRRIFMSFNKFGPQLIRLLTHSPAPARGRGGRRSLSLSTEATHATPMNSRGLGSAPPPGRALRSPSRLKENKSVACPQLRSTELCTSLKQECGPLITMSSINYYLKYGPWLVMDTPPPRPRGE